MGCAAALVPSGWLVSLQGEALGVMCWVTVFVWLMGCFLLMLAGFYVGCLG